MNKDFEQISIKPGFMKHNGGLLFKTISENEYQFKTVITENHLNAGGITHGGFISSVVDAGAGTAAHRAADNNPCVTISLELKLYLMKINDKELYAYNVYQIEGEGRSLFSKIEGDESTIMGLPIIQIKEYLNNFK